MLSYLIHRTSVSRRLVLASVVAAFGAAAIVPQAALAAPYDRTNPAGTGCANSAYAVGSNVLRTGTGQVVGRVELRYSTTCHTNWSRVTSSIGSQGLLAFAYRPSDGVSTWGYGGDPGPFYGTSAFSDQLYGYNVRVCAYGAINGVTGWSSFCA